MIYTPTPYIKGDFVRHSPALDDQGASFVEIRSLGDQGVSFVEIRSLVVPEFNEADP